MKGRSKRGKVRGLTRNQARKAAYAARSKAEQEVRRQSGVVGKHVRKASARKVGTRVHRHPCGNPACRECYYRIEGRGIYRR